MKYIFISIILRFTLIRNDNTCKGPLNESNRCLKIINIELEYLKTDRKKLHAHFYQQLQNMPNVPARTRKKKAT